MIPAFYTKKKASIGLALHRGRLGMIKLNQMTIEGLAIANVPAGCIVDGIQGIAEWVEVNEAKGCFAALALPASDVIHKRIRMAACLSDTEREAEIGSNLKHYLPGVNEPLYFDFIEIERQENEVELQLIAARAPQVESYVHAAKKVGLKVNRIDVDMYALVRAIHFFLSEKQRSEVVIILDVDVDAAQLILLKNGKIISMYPIVMEAEEIVLQQIKRGLDVFSNIDPTRKIETLILTGCLSQLNKLKSMLETTLSLSINVLNSIQAISINSELNLEQLTTSMPEWLAAWGLTL